MNCWYKFFLKSALLPGFLFTVFSLKSQDIHFSQFYRSPANLNPALSGVFAGDQRFIANYRSQWAAVPVPYRTVSGAYDARLRHKILGEKTFLGYGLVLNNDLAGDANFGLTQLGLSLACLRQISDEIVASLGAQVMTGQRSVQQSRLSFEEQWNGDIHDPKLSANEAFSKSQHLTSLTAGLNMRYQSGQSRTKVDFGGAFFHLNQPKASFTDDMDVKLPGKAVAYWLSNFQVNSVLDLKINAVFSRQLTYQEVVGGVAVRYYLHAARNRELAIQAGMAYRWGDALIPTLELQVRNWCAGVSYDLNYSPFRIATRRRGGPEFFLEYILWKVAPLKKFKACPIF